MQQTILLFLIFFTCNSALANNLVRSIEYTVSSDQSLNEARNNALNYIKAEVLSEYGALVQSEVSSTQDGNETTQTANYSEITGGHVKAKVKEELFDGSTLYLLVELNVDARSVREMLSIRYKEQVSSARIAELLKQKEKHEQEMAKLNKSNQLLKIQLNALKGRIEFASKSLDENLDTEKQIEVIKEKAAILRKVIEAKIKSEIEQAWQSYKLLGSIYTEGMTESDMNTILLGDFKANEISLLNTDFFIGEEKIYECDSYEGFVGIQRDIKNIPMGKVDSKFIHKFKYNGEYHYIGYLIDRKKNDSISRPVIFKTMSSPMGNSLYGFNNKTCHYTLTLLSGIEVYELVEKFNLE